MTSTAFIRYVSFEEICLQIGVSVYFSIFLYFDRFAFTVIWEMTQEAKIVNVKFMKSIIKSRVRNLTEIFGLQCNSNTNGHQYIFLVKNQFCYFLH